MSSKMSDYVLKLAFGKAEDGELPVRIHLSYPDEEKSFVAGEFTATVQ
jgi:hypothetical protein